MFKIYLECKFLNPYTNDNKICDCKQYSTDVGLFGNGGCQLCEYPCLECENSTRNCLSNN